MAGIYIHIPFCKQKCHYCNFFSQASLKNKSGFLNALHREIAFTSNYLLGEEINTIYFGGGTPSLLLFSEINEIIQKISQFHNINPGVEITLEANPDDLNQDYLFNLKKTSVNRLSIGVQSFYDEDLKYLNRLHDGERAKKSICDALEFGFQNLTIDLIYGIPGLNSEKWVENINICLDFSIPHISAYSLTVEPHTALFHLIKQGKVVSVNEEMAIQQFRYLSEKLRTEGYLHYEISNFCKQGYISQHNSNYWNGNKYLGLGPSAHSFNGFSRQWNVSSIQKYIEGIQKEEQIFEMEILKLEQRYNEYVMTSLRTIWGCDSKFIKNEFGNDFWLHFLNEAESETILGNLHEDSGVFFLTDRGKLFADGIASKLFK